MARLTLDVPFRPAFEPLFVGPRRYSVVVAHRRAGKTIASLQRLVLGALTLKAPDPRFGFIAPLRVQAKTIAWDPLKAMARQVPGVQVNESELRVDFPNGGRVRLYGADSPDAIRGGYLDGAVMDEHAQMDPDLWDKVVRPMLTDREGWAQFIGTPAGKNEFFRLFQAAENDPEWTRLMLRASETGIIPAHELKALRRTMSDEAFEQEYECSFTSAIRGRFYGTLMERAEAEGRITSVPYDPALPCVTSWDLGVRDATGIWILQPAPGGAIYAVEYIEGNGVGLPWYANELKARQYAYTEHHAPHDIEVTEFGTGRSRREIAASLGIHFAPAKQHKVADGIEAVRSILPRMWFDKDKCERGIQALSAYRQEWDNKLQSYKPTPLHDWSSHCADALRTYAMSNALAPESEYDDWSVSINLRRAKRRDEYTGRGYSRSRA